MCRSSYLIIHEYGPITRSNETFHQNEHFIIFSYDETLHLNLTKLIRIKNEFLSRFQPSREWHNAFMSNQVHH